MALLANDRFQLKSFEWVLPVNSVSDKSHGHNIRNIDSGEILPGHKTLLDYVEKLGGEWWGFTRKVDTHKAIPKLMFSIDATTPSSAMEYVRDEVPVHRRGYLRRPNDPQPPLEVAVTFPVHGPVTNYVHKVPIHETDCPAARKEVLGCWECKRCY